MKPKTEEPDVPDISHEFPQCDSIAYYETVIKGEDGLYRPLEVNGAVFRTADEMEGYLISKYQLENNENCILDKSGNRRHLIRVIE